MDTSVPVGKEQIDDAGTLDAASRMGGLDTRSLLAWVALGGVFNAVLEGELTHTAVDVDSFDPSKIAPAAGPTTNPKH